MLLTGWCIWKKSVLIYLNKKSQKVRYQDHSKKKKLEVYAKEQNSLMSRY